VRYASYLHYVGRVELSALPRTQRCCWGVFFKTVTRLSGQHEQVWVILVGLDHHSRWSYHAHVPVDGDAVNVVQCFVVGQHLSIFDVDSQFVLTSVLTALTYHVSHSFWSSNIINLMSEYLEFRNAGPRFSLIQILCKFADLTKLVLYVCRFDRTGLCYLPFPWRSIRPS
jgi:hypothetical protein